MSLIRNVAVCLTRGFRGDTLKQISAAFRIDRYSKISRVVARMKALVKLEKMMRASLPHETITHFFKGNIVMQEGYEITADSLRKLMKEKNVNTIEDFLAGFGFRRYEVYFRGTPRVSIEIRNVRNVIHAGGN